jgi:transcription elongation factor Elf1
MRIKIQSDFNKRKWLNRLFPFLTCEHETVSVEENLHTRYGMHVGYIYCLNCGRSASEIQSHCKHEVDCFGKCRLCLDRITKNDCKHEVWDKEPDTDDEYCDSCGIWKDKQV